MNPPEKPRSDLWTSPLSEQEAPEPGNDQWLSQEIEAGCAELDAGLGIAADEIWKLLGME